MKKTIMFATILLSLLAVGCGKEEKEKQEELNLYPQYPKDPTWLSSISSDSLLDLLTDRFWIREAKKRFGRNSYKLIGPYPPACFIDTLITRNPELWKIMEFRRYLSFWRTSFEKYHYKLSIIDGFVVKKISATSISFKELERAVGFIRSSSKESMTPEESLLWNVWIRKAKMNDMENVMQYSIWDVTGLVRDVYLKRNPSLCRLERLILSGYGFDNIIDAYLKKNPNKYSLMKLLVGNTDYPEVWQRFQNLHPTTVEYNELRKKARARGNTNLANDCEVMMLAIDRERNLERIAKEK